MMNRACPSWMIAIECGVDDHVYRAIRSDLKDGVTLEYMALDVVITPDDAL